MRGETQCELNDKPDPLYRCAILKNRNLETFCAARPLYGYEKRTNAFNASYAHKSQLPEAGSPGRGGKEMKQWIAFWRLVFLLILMLVISMGIRAVHSSGPALGPGDTGLKVNGRPIPCRIVYHQEQGYAEIPVLAVLKALEFPVNQVEEKVYELKMGEKRYRIDTGNGAVVDEDDPHQEDMIITTPGATFFYEQARDGDIYVDQESLRTLFLFLGVDARVRVDFTPETVTVTSGRF